MQWDGVEWLCRNDANNTNISHAFIVRAELPSISLCGNGLKLRQQSWASEGDPNFRVRCGWCLERVTLALGTGLLRSRRGRRVR